MIAIAMALVLAGPMNQREYGEMYKGLEDSVDVLVYLRGSETPRPTDCSKVMTYLGQAEAHPNPSAQLKSLMNAAAGHLWKKCRTVVNGRYAAGIDQLVAKVPR